MVDYFEDNWVGRTTRRQERISPTFSIPACGIKKKLPKTNNLIEGNKLVITNK